MPTPAWDDLDAFVDADDFAVVATLTLRAGAARRVRGIFDEPFMDRQLGEYVIDAAEPRFTCRAADVAGVKRYDRLAVGGVQYGVAHDPLPDGTGMAVLRLVREG